MLVGDPVGVLRLVAEEVRGRLDGMGLHLLMNGERVECVRPDHLRLLLEAAEVVLWHLGEAPYSVTSERVKERLRAALMEETRSSG